jgi:ATP-dependent helicase/nuclease subunit A
MKTSPRARWILRSHQDARSEYAITGVVGGEVVRGLVDRTFIDENGVRWIIDFKISSHEGGGLKAFLDEQQRRYSDQLERYARLFAPLGRPVRLGLYFPLLDGWREWGPRADA